MSGEPRPIGDVISIETGSVYRRLTHCGGASVFVDRDELRHFETTQGAEFLIPLGLPEDGRGFARVRCSGEAEQGRGVCSRCAALESENRRILRQATQRRAVPSSRRGDYDR